MAAAEAQVEKIMSMKLGDFRRGVQSLGFDFTRLDGAEGVRIDEQDFTVEIRYEAMDTQTYGTLLKIPRARVTLLFDGTSAEAQRKFLERFDFYFQKGGG